jgi:hypothetical protein
MRSNLLGALAQAIDLQPSRLLEGSSIAQDTNQR